MRLFQFGAAKATASATSALWTFPGILFSAFLIAWAAEAAQFLMAQGLALAILAWLQTLPEFAVEAVIAWHAGHDAPACFVSSPPAGCTSHLAIANFTGAVRLLIGLGWPMIYFVAAYYRKKHGRAMVAIELDPEHAVEVMGTIPPVLYFFWIWYKGSIDLVDSAVLIAMYLAYLAVLWRFPPKDEESLDDAPRVSRWAYRQRGIRRPLAILGLFVAGGAILYFTAHPFLESMLAIAATLGVSNFVFVQWVAPLLSEFPEKVSAFHWARQVKKADMALMNLVSSNVNQWTVLAAMIPIVFSVARGTPSALPFDGAQRLEILLTILQSIVAVLLLFDMRFDWWNAVLLFQLWLFGFVFADWRSFMCWAYGLWAVGLLLAWGRHLPAAPRTFVRLLRRRETP